MKYLANILFDLTLDRCAASLPLRPLPSRAGCQGVRRLKLEALLQTPDTVSAVFRNLEELPKWTKI